jgi:hypothetical protein
MHDLPGPDLPLTHELLAEMMVVRQKSHSGFAGFTDDSFALGGTSKRA